MSRTTEWAMQAQSGLALAVLAVAVWILTPPTLLWRLEHRRQGRR
jgi:hypothetical protein